MDLSSLHVHFAKLALTTRIYKFLTLTSPAGFGIDSSCYVIDVKNVIYYLSDGFNCQL